MCGHLEDPSNASSRSSGTKVASSHTRLASIVKEDLGIEVHPQALRMFMRHRWDKIAALAHNIHRGDD